jgi:hypothetical protein
VARTFRTRWWPRFLAAGGLLIGVGLTLFSGAAQEWVVGVGAAIIFALTIRSSVSPVSVVAAAQSLHGTRRDQQVFRR